MTNGRLLFASAALLTMQLAIAQTPPASPAPAANILAVPPDAPPPKEIGPGPYAVTIESDPGLATHTVYRPTDLQPFSSKNPLPIVSWGNGGCRNVGQMFRNFLEQVASHGYVVIAVGPKDAPLPNLTTGGSSGEPRAQMPAPPTRDEQLIDAIDWALRENSRKGSAYYGRLNPNAIAVMGQSCGGLQTMAVSADPRLKTVVLWNSGVLTAGSASIGARLSKASKDDLAKLHTPIAYFIGGPTDVAYPNAEDDFARITNVPVFKANLNVGHGGTFRHPRGGWYSEVGVAWLDYQLKGDRTAATYFEGAQCKLCSDPAWKVEKKNMP